MSSTTLDGAAPPGEASARASDGRALAPPTWERRLLAVAVALGAASFLMAPRLPMIDFPGHAGQIALWRDLLLGVSPFADELRINLLTPYLIGYGLALPFSFFMPQALAMQGVLAAAFLAFVWAARGLRKELGGDPRLDWLFLFGFFGLAWMWGFYTFLVAAPLALLTIRQAVRFDAAPGVGRAGALLACGFLLLFSHGLQFLFACLMGAAITLERFLREGRAAGWRAAFVAAATRAPPYVALAALFATMMLLRRDGADPSVATEVVFGRPVWVRPLDALMNVGTWHFSLVHLGATLAAFSAPVLMGFTVAPGPARAMLIALALQLAFGPASAVGTGFLSDRFALYLAAIWALALRPGPLAPARARFAAILPLAAFVALGLHLWRIEAFRREDRGFDAILAAVRPGERVLNLAFDKWSHAIPMENHYIHWAHWLQSERGAFVDFNFAYFPPQVVRFRLDRIPPVRDAQGWSPQLFDWTSWDGARYDLFLTRGTQEQKQQFLLSRSPCALDVAAQVGEWTLYRKGACPR